MGRTVLSAADLGVAPAATGTVATPTRPDPLANRKDPFARIDRFKGHPIAFVPSRDLQTQRPAARPEYPRHLGVKEGALVYTDGETETAFPLLLSGHPRYYALLDELRQLHHDKNRAYGTAEDPFKNFTNGKDYGLTKVQMIVARLADKISRFQNDARRDFAAIPGMGQDNETPEMTYRDIASLFLILSLTLEERRAAEGVAKAAGRDADARPGHE